MPDGSDAVPQPPPDETSPPSPLTPPWTPPRRRLLSWLKEKAPSLAELYETAITLLETQPLPGRSRIIAHCVREIANSLPAILAGVERTRLEYDKRLDDIASAWQRLTGLPVLPHTARESGSVPGPREALTNEFLRQVKGLIEDHLATRTKQETIAERLFQANRPENRHLGDALRPVLRQWIALRNWFQGHAHDGGRTDADVDWVAFQRKITLFEETILTLGQGFFATITDLDELLRTATPEQVDMVIAHFGHIEHYRYFFERLQDPTWIPAFKSKGIFRQPPPIESAGIPRWAASEYLVRVADRAPDHSVVMDTLLEIATALAQQTRPNPFVIRDLVDVSLKLPGDQAIRIVPKLKAWVHHVDGFYFVRRIGKLASHLAQQGKSAEALALISPLLAIERPVRDDPESPYQPVKPRIRISDYREIVEGRLSAVLQVTGCQLFDILCNILQRAAKLSRRSHATEEWDDNSIVWHPVIGEQDEDDRDDVRSVLVSATREAAEYLVTDRGEGLRALVEGLESRRWLIFRRLAFYLLRIFPSAPRDMIAARLTNDPLFRDRTLRAEYDLLLRARFGDLTVEEKQTILGWIESGPPNLEHRIARYAESWGRQLTSEEIQSYRRQWQWDRLAPCRHALPEEWQDRYTTMAAEFGEPEPRPARIGARSVAVGDHAPRSEEELLALTPEALREYLVTWQPDRAEFPRPTRSGLSEVLSSLVTKDPERFAAAAGEWEGLDPTYLHGIVRGFTKAIEEGRQITWDRVLTLCSWVLQQPREIPGRSVDRWESDPDWGGTRWWIVELLRVGFQHATLAIPIALREKAWRLLEILTNDPNPEPEDEEEDYGRPGQSMHRAINSIRGRAIEGIIFYPGWIRQQSANAAGIDLSEAAPAQLPLEARAVLDLHLDHQRERSLAIRSLYGRWFPWLLVFDRPWATAAIPRIFTEPDPRYWLVAWDGFICFCEAYEEAFEPLQPVYAHAIARLGSPANDEEDDTRHLRDKRLAGHLMTFYWRGHYPLDDNEGHLRSFFAAAPDRIRAKAIEFIGRSLENTTDPIEPVILERLQQLLIWRFEVAQEAPKNHEAELRAFGWCFSSGKFEARWALETLLSAVRLTQAIDPDYLVLERLPDHATVFPFEVLESVRLLIEGQSSHMELSSWGGDLRRIFMQTKEHQVPEVRQASNAVIELLGRFGHLGYKDLLSTAST